MNCRLACFGVLCLLFANDSELCQFGKLAVGNSTNVSTLNSSISKNSSFIVGAKRACGHNAFWNNGEMPGQIVGGVSARNSEFPWHVKVNFKSSEATYLCSGTIIDSRYVLTAAHCCRPSMIKVEILRTWDLDSSKTNRKLSISLSNIHRHPRYSETDQQLDFCLLRLPEKLNFTNDWSLQPICLPTSCSETCQTGDVAIITGWGVTGQDMAVPSDLQKAIVPIWSKKDCIAKYGNVPYKIEDSHVCAGFKMGGTSTCHGDSGTALACYKTGYFTIDGVASWGALPCTGDYPAVFGRVCSESVLTWIASFLNN